MAFFDFARGEPLPDRLRSGKEHLRLARDEIDAVVRALAGMTDEQIMAKFKFTDGTGSATAEIAGEAKDLLIANWAKTMADGTTAGDAIRAILDGLAS